jgi:chloramphenicol-sensitive protein RarD
MTIDTAAMFVPALVTIGVIALQGNLVFGSHGVGNALLLAGTGLVTAVPLLLFAAGTRRLPLSVWGSITSARHVWGGAVRRRDGIR